MGLALLSAPSPLSMDSLLPGLYLDFRAVALSGGSLSLYLHSRCSSLALLCFLTALYEFTPWTRGLLVPLEVGTLWTRVFLDPPSLTHTVTLVTLLSQLSHSLSCPTAPSSLKESWTLLPMDLGRPVVGFQGGLAGPLKGEATLHSHCSCSHGSQFSHYSLLSR